MNKLFTKIATLSVGLAMAIGVGVAASVGRTAKSVKAADTTIDLTAQGFSNQQEVTDVTSGTITLTFAKASGSNAPKYYTSGASVRTYASNTLTVATSGSDSITQIVFTLGGTTTATPTANTGTYNSSTKTWTGSASSVTFTNAASGQYHYKTVAVTTGGGGGVDPVLTGITISGEQTTYTVGDEFVKPTVTAHYDDDSSTDVTSSASFSGYNMGVAGEYTVTVSYGGKSTTYDITVNDVEPEGEVLYSATFTEVETHSYTQNKTFTLNEKSWTASVSQVNSSIFYLGCNSTHTAKGILNDNESFSDVVTVLSSVDTPYGNAYTTAHAYAMRFDHSYENVGSIEFVWSGGNNAFQVYLFGDRGSGLESLAHVNYATSGATTAGSIKWTAEAYGEDFSSIIIVARPGATGSTAKDKTIRPATFKIIEGESPSLIDTAIYDSSKEEGPFEVVVGNTLPLFYYDLSVDNYIEDATWVSSDPTVFAASGQTSDNWYFHGIGLKEGQVTMTASKSGYKVAQAIVNVVPDPTLPEMEIWDTSGKVPASTGLRYSSTEGIYKFTARDVNDTSVQVSDAVWESSDTTVATVTSNAGQCSLTTLKPGSFNLTATSSSHQSVTIELAVVKGYLQELSYDGNPTKTSYTDSESWSAAGLTITALYNTGWEEDVTSLVSWTYDPATPTVGVTSLTYTATYEDVASASIESVTTAPFAVTVTHPHAGTADDPFTVAEALAKAAEIGPVGSSGQGPWVTTGIISRVTSAPAATYWNATYYISDDGSQTNELQVYRGYYLDNAKFDAETALLLTAGKVVTVTGNLTGSYGSEYCQGNYLLDIHSPSTGDIDVTFEPELNIELGDSGTFTASTDATSPVYTWSVEDSSILSVDASTGDFEGLKLGTTKVTVNVSAVEGNGEASAFITVNGADTYTIEEANEIAAGEPSGTTTSYYIYVEGYVSLFNSDGQSAGNERAFDISNYDENESIMVFVGKSGYSSFISGMKLGDYVRVKAYVQNYGGKYELTTPTKVESYYSDVSFAYELLELTDAVCKDYDGVTDNKEALEAVWETLVDSSHYGALTSEQIENLVDADASESGTTIQKAMARYDYLVGKYKLDNFISGRTPVVFANQPIQTSNNSINTNFAMIAVIVVAVTSLSAIGVLLVVKKRKYHN